MESPIDVTIDIALEFEIGSPPDGDLDPYQVFNPSLMTLSSTWMSREGMNEGMLTSATTALYPPFEDANRRTIFGTYQFALGGSQFPTLTWNGSVVYLNHLWILTDPSWATSMATVSLTEGSWFAIEGELESDYRIWRRGQSVDATL